MSELTWGQLKKMIDETEGVTDDTEIDYFDFSAMRLYTGLEISVEGDNKLCVWA